MCTYTYMADSIHYIFVRSYTYFLLLLRWDHIYCWFMLICKWSCINCCMAIVV
jgi:hypothetical protein